MRKVVFQLHLWSGMLLGLYVVVVCASGSAIVFRNDIYDWLEAGGKGVSYKASLYHWLSWLGNLHGSLLMDSDGMTANAIGGFLIAALCLTGMIVWWPGIANWRRALTIRAKVGWKRFIFDLHSAVGFWTFAVLLMWGLTGGYFVFPQPFRAAITFFTPIDAPPAFQSAAPSAPSIVGPKPRPRRRPLTLGAKILRGFSFAHYGNFGGWGVKTLWVILGLAPAALFSTALLMWWNRVMAPAMRRLRKTNMTAPTQL
ncbi:MAG: PepSY-associated TM helix domain-containing protein [Bryobacteraceae bacterium]